MEFIKNILAKHLDDNGVLKLDEAVSEINAEFPKNAVPKSQYNNQAEQLKTAKDTLTQLQNDNKGNETLQDDVKKYKDEIAKLEAELNTTKIETSAKSALTAAGVKDVDYALYKLGALELTKDGSIKDWDSKLKDLQTAIPDYFDKADNKPADPSKPGYQVVDNKLKSGSEKTQFSVDQLKGMTPEEINENWDAISSAGTIGAEGE